MAIRALAAYAAYVHKKSADETTADLAQPIRRVRSWLIGMTEALTASGIFPKAAGPCRPAAERHHQIMRTGVPPSSKVAKYISLECVAMAPVPVYCTIVR